MKISDYVVSFLENHNIATVFGYQGSSISHLVDSLSKNNKLKYVQVCHEQAASFAANGYALARNDAGVAISCSGPGATNLITGIADAFYDSLPCFFISGQVSTFEMRQNTNLRQLGFQETDIVSIVDPITKYAVTIKDASAIAYHLEKAFYLMKHRRPGPVLIDIPHNIQTSNIDEDALSHFDVPKNNYFIDEQVIAENAQMLRSARRPVIILGGGGQALKNDPIFGNFLKKWSIPVVTSYRGKDIIDNECPNYIGVLGVYGNRSANYAVKHSDLLLVIGSRLDGRQTGGDLTTFADNKKVIIVDIDENELANKPENYIKVNCDVSVYIDIITKYLDDYNGAINWLNIVNNWKYRFPDGKEYNIKDFVNPNLFLNKLSKFAADDTIFTVDVGQNQIWSNASLSIKKRARLIQSCGLGSMGFSLPGAIGAYYAHSSPVICICGDGGFQMNIQELQTISQNKIPVKIFIMNNHSLGLIRIYQDKALQSNHEGSVKGFGSPDYSILAQAYSLGYYRIDNNDCDAMIKEILNDSQPCIIEVCISENSTCCPEPTYKQTVENQSPLLAMAEIERIECEAHESN